MNGAANFNDIASTMSRVVTVTQGQLQGYNVKIQTGDGQEFDVEQFLEIPYAQPPVGELRFQKPVPATPWNGIKLTPRQPTRVGPQLLVSKFGENHPGEVIWNPTEEQTEDCLFLNVWNACKEANDDNSLKPVMVWIYGGGFVTGSASLDIYNGSWLASLGDVIVVNVNYRLGELGFLPVPCPDLDGKFIANQGLWDQCLALEWIRDNIAAFGGDPNNVCLFGESAGAASVGLHLFSPKCLGRGLFHKAIIQSGSPLSEWAITPVEILVQRGEKLREHLFSQFANENTLFTKQNILQTISAQHLIESADLYNPGGPYIPIPWTPCIDGDYFPKNLNDIFKDAEYPFCPVIIGTTRDEASSFFLYEDLDESMKLPESSLVHLLAKWQGFPEHSDHFKAIVEHYSNGNTEVGEDVLFNSMSDRFFMRATYQLIDALSHLTSCWLYRFSYRSPDRHPWPEWTGVMHGDDIAYIFGLPLREFDPEHDEDAKMSLQMIQLWTTFAKLGIPSLEGVSWSKAVGRKEHGKLDLPQYLELANNKIVVERDDRMARDLPFWNSILP